MPDMKAAFTLFWFRRDLRLKDNAGLYRALIDAKEHGLQCQPVFIFDTDILTALNNPDDFRMSFLWQTVADLRKELQAVGSDLWVLHGKPQDIFAKLFAQHSVSAVYSNEDYEPSAITRDKSIQKLSQTKGIRFQQEKDQVVFSKDELLTTQGSPYTVFTPYKNKWLDTLDEFYQTPYPSEKYSQFLKPRLQPMDFITLQELGFRHYPEDFYPPRKVQLKTLRNYKDTRDFPATKGGTSQLGIHLRFGTISPRLLVRTAIKENASTFLSELIWREFFMQILWHFPKNETKSFRRQYDDIAWRTNRSEFDRWCRGETGVPLVDAGMRELNQTGHMHNRVRMVVGSYLTKHLLMHWHMGERYFAKLLLDYDLAANNGNWQ